MTWTMTNVQEDMENHRLVLHKREHPHGPRMLKKEHGYGHRVL